MVKSAKTVAVNKVAALRLVSRIRLRSAYRAGGALCHHPAGCSTGHDRHQRTSWEPDACQYRTLAIVSDGSESSLTLSVIFTLPPSFYRESLSSHSLSNTSRPTNMHGRSPSQGRIFPTTSRSSRYVSTDPDTG